MPISQPVPPSFEGLGTFSDSGYEITLPPTNTGSNFGIINDRPSIEGAFIDENTQLLIEATIGEFNDGDFTVAIREDTGSGEFFTVGVSAADLADDGQAIVNLSDFNFNGDTTDGIPNGTVFDAGLQSDFFSGNAVDFAIQRITALNTTAPIRGDADENGIVNFEDIALFIQIVQSGSFLEQVDLNRDDDVDFSDVFPFVAILIRQ